MRSLLRVGGALREHAVEMIFIGIANEEQTREFVTQFVYGANDDRAGANHSDKFAARLLIDADGSLFKALTLHRGVLRSLLLPLWSGLKTHGIRPIIEGLRLGVESHELAGDSWQQGGAFVFRDAKCVFSFREEHPGQSYDSQALLQDALALPDNVTLDEEQALDDYHQHRQLYRSTHSFRFKYLRLFCLISVFVIVSVVLYAFAL